MNGSDKITLQKCKKDKMENGEFCQVCGRKGNVTLHHLREIKSNHNKRGKVNGIICLCRKCHDIVEDIVNKGKSKKLWFNKGYEKGLKESGDLLHKDNHTIGCMLEVYEGVLRFRGFDREGDMLMEVASRIK